MANPMRNEMTIKLGEVEILLRPTFSNISELEEETGGIPMLAYRLSKTELPKMTDLAKIIYYCQAEKKHTLEKIWDLVLQEGAAVTTQVLTFVAKITAGDKINESLGESEKKS